MFTSSKKTGKLKVEFRVPSLSRLHGWDNFNRAQLNNQALENIKGSGDTRHGS